MTDDVFSDGGFGFSFHTRNLERGLQYSMGQITEFERPRSMIFYNMVADQTWKMAYPYEVVNACRR